jgi:hypothetical protein
MKLKIAQHKQDPKLDFFIGIQKFTINLQRSPSSLLHFIIRIEELVHDTLLI